MFTYTWLVLACNSCNSIYWCCASRMVNARPSSIIPPYRGIDSLCQLGPAQFVPADNKSEWMRAYVLSDNAVCVCTCA